MAAALLNVRKAVLTHLKADTAVTALVPAARISHNLEAAYPRLRVLRVGGAGDPFFRDQALIQLEAIGEPNDYSDAMQETLESALSKAAYSVWQMENATSSGVRVSSVRMVTNQQAGPDDSTKQLRVFCRLLLTAHAVA